MSEVKTLVHSLIFLLSESNSGQHDDDFYSSSPGKSKITDGATSADFALSSAKW